ncbi:MAG: hypothetical protein QOF89_2810 [Acidobacteriota bacterium]|jgi:hypothetical protein|nr:hypothetical protein [Acidobacteriota bacterium]
MRIRTGWAVLLGVGLFLTAFSPASACWLCTTGSGSSGLDCALEIGETGGTSCFINCRTTQNVDRCYCRTLGVCGGSSDCGGQPCPTAQPSQPGSPGKVFLTRDMYRALEESNPDAAMLLANFVKNSDALAVGLRFGEPLIPGDYQGLFTETPTGIPALRKTYRFEATVVQEMDRVVVNVRVFDHPTMKSLYAQIRNGDAGNIVEVVDLRGRRSRIEM